MKDLPAFLRGPVPGSPPPGFSRRRVRIPFLEKGIHHFSRIVQTGYAHWESSNRDGLLQRVDARIKVSLLAFLIVVVSLKRAVAPQAGIAAFILLLFAIARLEIVTIYKRILALGLLFGVLVPFPYAFNLLSDGEILFPVFRLPRTYGVWIYRIPEVIGVTREGVHGIALLFLRVTNSVALSFLLLYTTPFTDVVKALRIFRVPDTFVVVITLSYKYLFLFTRTVEDMHLAKKSRLLGPLPDREARRWVAERLAFLYRRSQIRCEGIFKAMLSRGFTRDVELRTFRPLAARDWGVAATILGAGVFFLAW
jgi:cobalt ECF transporter T component CbiQ